MTVKVHVGRRVPKSWFRRQASRVKGLMTFQENIWQMIKTSLRKAKKKADSDGRMKFILNEDMESEDLNYQIEWLIMTIMGTKEMEEEEYQESLKLYESLGKQFKREFPKDENLARHFKTKRLPGFKIEEAYEKGYGVMENNNISNKLLEMGIMTHVEKIDDYEEREPMPL